MQYLNVNLSMDEENFSNLSSQIYQEVSDKIISDMKDELRDEVIDHIDIGGEVGNWMDYNFDASEHIRQSDVREALDLDQIIEERAQSLLEIYDPARSCRTGNLFTSAVFTAIEYIFTNEEFLSELIDVMQKHEELKKKLEKENTAVYASISEALQSIYFGTL